MLPGGGGGALPWNCGDIGGFVGIGGGGRLILFSEGRAGDFGEVGS